MLEIRGDLDLGQEPFGSQLGFQDLQRDLAFVLDIVGQVDGSHPAFAELTLDRVATVKGKQRPVPQARDRDRSGVRAARSPFADYFGRIVPPDWC